MRDADAFGDGARVVDVAAGAAGALAVGRRAVIVELQRDADDVIAGSASSAAVTDEIDAARHGDDDTRVGRAALDVEIVWHCGAVTLPEEIPRIASGASLRQADPHTYYMWRAFAPPRLLRRAYPLCLPRYAYSTTSTSSRRFERRQPGSKRRPPRRHTALIAVRRDFGL